MGIYNDLHSYLCFNQLLLRYIDTFGGVKPVSDKNDDPVSNTYRYGSLGPKDSRVPKYSLTITSVATKVIIPTSFKTMPNFFINYIDFLIILLTLTFLEL